MYVICIYRVRPNSPSLLLSPNPISSFHVKVYLTRLPRVTILLEFLLCITRDSFKPSLPSFPIRPCLGSVPDLDRNNVLVPPPVTPTSTHSSYTVLTWTLWSRTSWNFENRNWTCSTFFRDLRRFVSSLNLTQNFLHKTDTKIFISRHPRSQPSSLWLNLRKSMRNGPSFLSSFTLSCCVIVRTGLDFGVVFGRFFFLGGIGLFTTVQLKGSPTYQQSLPTHNFWRTRSCLMYSEITR